MKNAEHVSQKTGFIGRVFFLKTYDLAKNSYVIGDRLRIFELAKNLGQRVFSSMMHTEFRDG